MMREMMEQMFCSILTVVSQPKTKIVMASLESRDRVASKRDLATVVARFLVLNRNSRPDNIR